ncbi:Na+/H+ antiporter [Silvibacterium acidisoli]|uniref:Na+/H+ antiporter n=1 Tax=Acidobacteriaceae bacterium ZG23-2 TaxID=2883246 RepID=UPI00406C52DA
MGHGIHGIETTLLALVSLVAVLGALAQRLKVPYPIVLLLGGLALTFIPLPPQISLNISLNPHFVFLVVLPPLLFASALNTSWREFRYNLVSIAMLGVGLVAFTVFGVALVAHLFMRDFDWRVGAVLGAVVSTTDAIAVAAIARRVGMPEALLELVEGESLINDATGLLALQFTTALVVSGEAPSVFQGVEQFVWLVVGGAIAGLVVAMLISWFDRRFSTAALQTLVSLATPFSAYLLGESMHASGVLATVACGLYLGRARSDVYTTEARLDSQAIWNMLDFAINSLVFIVIGLQLPVVMRGIHPLHWDHLVGGALFVCAVVIGLRMAWVFPGGKFAYFIRRRLLGQPLSKPNPREMVVVGWSGMRGVLTLAAALSLPELTDTGQAFPHRQLLIFLAFSVILVSLVGQGLSLPALMRKLGVSESPERMDEEREARRRLLEAAIDHLEAIDTSSDDAEGEAVSVLERVYRQRLKGVTEEDQEAAKDVNLRYKRLVAEARQAERDELNRMRSQGSMHESILRELERDLDLAELRWRNPASS